MHDVFLSYSRVDGDFAEVVRARLGEGGCHCWLDRSEIQAGEAWCEEIDEAIRGASAVVLILTPSARASEFVNYEWAFALGAGVPLIPLMLQPTPLPPRLATLHHLDFTRRETRPWNDLTERVRALVGERRAQVVKVSPTAPAIVKDAVGALDDPDPGLATQAVSRLARIQLPEAEAALVAAMAHPVVDVRVAAAGELARRGDSRAVPGLLEGNRCMGWHLELGRRIKPIGAAAIPELRRALADPEAWQRRDVVWALASIGDESVIPDLSRQVEDPDAEVRREAFRALHRWETPEALAAIREKWPIILRDLHSTDADVRRRTCQFLDELGTREAQTALAGAATPSREAAESETDGQSAGLGEGGRG
ncbi:MAG: HEAT repeat domain-containing protein [Verrucomicrobiales bacterium]|nr:HEAT repeat domain-containing protein [Verrucomicrobiales bacterium]